MNYSSIFGPKLKTCFGKDITTSLLDSVEYIGIYFSGYWCPPSKIFDQKLAGVYKEINSLGKVRDIFRV